MMYAYSIETYDAVHQRRTFLKMPATTTSAKGIIDLDMERQARLRTSSGPIIEQNKAIALRDMVLSDAAVEAMEQILADPTIPSHKGVRARTVSPEDLLRRFGR